MTYMNNIGPEEITRRKTTSDSKNLTDDLTFNSKDSSDVRKRIEDILGAKELEESLTLSC